VSQQMASSKLAGLSYPTYRPFSPDCGNSAY
jgi:hypothetical protein